MVHLSLIFIESAEVWMDHINVDIIYPSLCHEMIGGTFFVHFYPRFPLMHGTTPL
jgi:hypothetical protein